MEQHRRQEILEYLKVQWSDIHHTRNQDWVMLAVILGVFSALFKLNERGFPDTSTTRLQEIVTTIGICASAVGGFISLAHRRLFRNKLAIIKKCEQALSINADAMFMPSRLRVQGIFIYVYIAIGGILVMWAIWLLSHAMWMGAAAGLAWGILGILASFISAKSLVHFLKTKESFPLFTADTSLKHPYVAQLSDIELCLSQMAPRPLKLIADQLCPSLNESPWLDTQWAFSCQDGRLQDRKLLAQTEDSFQLSVADSLSNQDYHKHEAVFDIYASVHPIQVAYRLEGGTEQRVDIQAGIVIVPPGLEHRMKLSGITFVFQAATQGGQVHGDKCKVD
jgi:hypothetical protein